MNWKSIVGYEGRYQVSDCGSVRQHNGRVLKQWANDQGYCLVRLSKPRATFRVHRLVAEAFIANPEYLPCVNHLDCVRHNNHAANLEWCTQQHNLAHAAQLGRMQRDHWKGKRSPTASLTDEEAQAIRQTYAKGGISWEKLAVIFQTNKRTVGRIIRGETYV